MKTKLALATVLAALIGAAPAAADKPYYENPCGVPTTDVYWSDATDHAWIEVSTGIEVPAGGPSDGVYRLYAASVNDGSGWSPAVYYEWRHCYRQ
jgi:hypothetical protein